MKIQAIYHTELNLPNRIESYFHCRRCLEERPADTTPADWSRTQTGITDDGFFQVWCNRHNINVARIELKLKPRLPDEPHPPEWAPGTLVYIKEVIGDHGVAPAGIGRVVEDMDDHVLVRFLDSDEFLQDKLIDIDREEDIAREYLQKIIPS